jgi:menaquinone-dependent protoporphyrinogen oxidase
MCKVLIVYATKSGCTKGVAGKIASTIAGPGVKVKLASASDSPDPSCYDAVLVGSGIRAGKWHESARAWVAANAEALKSKRVAFFTVGLLITKGAEKAAQVRGFTDSLIEETGVQPLDVGVFAGWNEPELFSFPERLVVKVMKAPKGDQRDWAAIEQWARATVQTLAA